MDVKPLQDFKVWLKFSDGVEGTVDLSDVAGKGVFCAWNDPEIFNYLYFREHNPPHFHAVYGEEKVLIKIPKEVKRFREEDIGDS